MPITELQRKERRKAIGSSDVAALLGIDPYRTPYDLWLEKTGRLEEQGPEAPSAAADAGNRFEPAVLDFAQERLGPLIRNQRRVRPELYLAVNLDAVVRRNGEPVEGKTAGLFSPLIDPWGEPETDQVPDRVLAQTHGQMLTVKKEICHVPSFLAGRGFLMFCVPFNPDLGNEIAERAVAFWENNVLADTPPEGVASLPVLKRMRRVPKKITTLGENLLTDWLTAKEKAAQAGKVAEAVQSVLLTALGDAEAARFPSGEAVTYFEQGRADLDVKRLRAEKPEVAVEYMRETAFRVLRHKKKGL